jgi:hypothetical protein
MFTRLTALRTSEKEMDTRAQIESLRAMTTGQLRDKYGEVFGEPSRSCCEYACGGNSRQAQSGLPDATPVSGSAPD